ncbi:hypothetical protein LWF15_11085 [Kineosporia rhizophila]|uniref:helix-turn-helix domain-containing protein n=1 Tax=Kineosporia rhizophila TaxID=84633 RepID=UPI001E5A8B74|nr:hypothetical protein [Kineosporia rhizophila]MCE0536054.1 hypothetical protein [Kineosporia rhizophila]
MADRSDVTAPESISLASEGNSPNFGQFAMVELPEPVVVTTWSGMEAAALRQALRLSLIRFAEHLGISVRSASKWEAQGRSAIISLECQGILDTALDRATSKQRARFVGLIRGKGDIYILAQTRV